ASTSTFSPIIKPAGPRSASQFSGHRRRYKGGLSLGEDDQFNRGREYDANIPIAHQRTPESVLLPDAERGEDSVKNVVRRGGAGHRVNRSQRRIQIKQQHLVWNLIFDGASGVFKRLQALPQQSFVPDAGDSSTLRSRQTFGRKAMKDLVL